MKPHPNLIALCGLAGSGKSTAAEHLMHQGFCRVKFADPLKDMLRVLGLDNRHLEGDLKEVPCDLLQGQTPRFAMQRLGTEWGRDIMHPDFWVNVWKMRAESIMATGESVVVDDCRFPNELKAVNQLGGISVMIERPGLASVESHISEQHALETDITLVNDGSIRDLKNKLNQIL